MSEQILRIGPEVPFDYEGPRGGCLTCGGDCAPECGRHPAGCIYGGGTVAYWLIADECGLNHGESA